MSERRTTEVIAAIQAEKAKEDSAAVTAVLDEEEKVLGQYKRPALDEPIVEGDVDPLR